MNSEKTLSSVLKARLAFLTQELLLKENSPSSLFQTIGTILFPEIKQPVEPAPLQYFREQVETNPKTVVEPYTPQKITSYDLPKVSSREKLFLLYKLYSIASIYEAASITGAFIRKVYKVVSFMYDTPALPVYGSLTEEAFTEALKKITPDMVKLTFEKAFYFYGLDHGESDFINRKEVQEIINDESFKMTAKVQNEDKLSDYLKTLYLSVVTAIDREVKDYQAKNIQIKKSVSFDFGAFFIGLGAGIAGLYIILFIVAQIMVK